MKLNFNNEKEVTFTKKTIDKVVGAVEKTITGNSEHFWLEYKKSGKSIEKKWLRTEYSDAEILKDVEKFLKKAVA